MRRPTTPWAGVAGDRRWQWSRVSRRRAPRVRLGVKPWTRSRPRTAGVTAVRAGADRTCPAAVVVRQFPMRAITLLCPSAQRVAASGAGWTKAKLDRQRWSMGACSYLVFRARPATRRKMGRCGPSHDHHMAPRYDGHAAATSSSAASWPTNMSLYLHRPRHRTGGGARRGGDTFFAAGSPGAASLAGRCRLGAGNGPRTAGRSPRVLEQPQSPASRNHLSASHILTPGGYT